MKIIKTISLVFLAVMLTSCNGVSPRTSPTVAMETAMALVQTAVDETQVAIATITPALLPMTVTPLPTSLPGPETIPTLSMTEVSFWGNLDSMPSNISVTEYTLPPEKNPIVNDGLFQFLPTQAWTVGRAVPSPTPHQITIKELGYETRSIYTTSGTVSGFQLYRDGRLLLDKFVNVSKVYTFSTDTGPITAFIVEVDSAGRGRQNYLIQNDAIYFYGEYAIHEFSPILYQGELLWARTYSDHTEVKKSTGYVILTIPSDWMHRPRFFAWNGHWILEADDTVAVDGEILNKKIDFDEVFNWGLVKNKPTYFFRKGPRVGISHDGQIFPVNYQNVAHGLCCGPAQNNPSMGKDGINFFGERDGVWYYVVMKFK